MRINTLLLGGLMAMVGAITLWASKDFSSMPRQDYGAGTFPTIIGVLLIILSGLLGLRGWRQREPLFTWHGAVPLMRVWISLGAVSIAVAAYALATPILGFPITVPVIFTLLIGWLSQGRWGLAIITALAATLIVWLAFAQLLQVPLDLGVLENVVY
tara:strand:- start:19110 stop:19580 length:471 start_codon:yes stop_codon:yes gene_type:complete